MFFLAPIFILGSGKVDAQKVVSAYNLKDIKLNLDGNLNEPIWKNLPVADFTQRDPNEGQKATEKTEVWVAYDNENIYVAARLHDSQPHSIDASIARRDSRFDSDWFIFYVDPYNDKKTGYYFAVNAGGSLVDGVLFNDSWNDDSWDGVWDAKTSVDDEGWIVKMKIPFSQLRFNPAQEMSWGVNFERDIKRNKEIDYYVMVPKKESGFVSRFARLEGLVGIQQKQRVEILPYAVQKFQSLVHDLGDPFYKSKQYKTTIGGDVKIGVGGTLTLDATFNPDFGQVEVDPAVINLSAFESYFNEKRPFFIEGSNTFYYGYGVGGANNTWGFNFSWPEIFYSRRIGRSPHAGIESADFVSSPGVTSIIGAAKLTGKLNATTSIGAISAFTERTYGSFSKNGIIGSQEVEPLTHYGVFRTKKEINDGNQGLGLVFTTVNRNLDNDILKNSLSQNAFTYGIDGWTFLDEKKEYVLNGAFSGSYVNGTKEYLIQLQEQPYRYFQRPDANFARLDSNKTSLSGYYGRLMLNKQNGNFYINSSVGVVSPGYEFNDLGFQWMADRINEHLVLGYRWFDPDSLFRGKYIYLAQATSRNFDGNVISNFVWWNGGVDFLNYWGIQFIGNYSPDTYTFDGTRGGPLAKNPGGYALNLYAYSDSRKDVVVNFYPSFYKNHIGSEDIYVGFDVTWKPNSQINFSIGPSYDHNENHSQWVGNFIDPTATNMYGSRYVFALIHQRTLSMNIRLNWTFSPTLSLQLFMQPFFAMGNYTNFKELAEPRTYDLTEYGTSGSTISYDANNNLYNVDPDGNGPAQAFTFSNPNFNYKSLRGTAVLRWEVLPGSIFYFVWSHNQTNFENPGDFSLSRDFKNLWNTQGDNIFLVKFSYWLDI